MQLAVMEVSRQTEENLPIGKSMGEVSGIIHQKCKILGFDMDTHVVSFMYLYFVPENFQYVKYPFAKILPFLMRKTKP